MQLRWWLYDQRDRLADLWEKVWLCKIRDKHHVKMQSYGRCYRCNKLIRAEGRH